MAKLDSLEIQAWSVSLVWNIVAPRISQLGASQKKHFNTQMDINGRSQSSNKDAKSTKTQLEHFNAAQSRLLDPLALQLFGA